MPLLNVAVPPLAVATRSFSVLCPCHQCNSDHFVAFALLYISAQCLRYAIQGSTKPLRLNTNPCNTLAIQLISIHHLRQANHCFAFALRHFSVLCLCCSIPSIAYHCLCKSKPRVSLPSHYISMLFAALAILYISSPCLRRSTQVTSLPRNTAASLRVLHSAIA